MTLQLATLCNCPLSNQSSSQLKMPLRLQILTNISKFIGYSRLASVGVARLSEKMSCCNLVLVFLLMNNTCPFSSSYFSAIISTAKQPNYCLWWESVQKLMVPDRNSLNSSTNIGPYMAHRFSWALFKHNNFSNFCPFATFDSSKYG